MACVSRSGSLLRICGAPCLLTRWTSAIFVVGVGMGVDGESREGMWGGCSRKRTEGLSYHFAGSLRICIIRERKEETTDREASTSLWLFRNDNRMKMRCKEKVRCPFEYSLKHDWHNKPCIPCFPFRTRHYRDMGRLCGLYQPIGGQAGQIDGELSPSC